MSAFKNFDVSLVVGAAARYIVGTDMSPTALWDMERRLRILDVAELSLGQRRAMQRADQFCIYPGCIHIPSVRVRLVKRGPHGQMFDAGVFYFCGLHVMKELRGGEE